MSSRRGAPRSKRKSSSPYPKKPSEGSQSRSPSKGQPAEDKRSSSNPAFDTEHAPYLQALLENHPLATMILDTKHRVQMCNPAFERLFGYAQSDILGKDINPMLATPGQPDEPATFARRATRGEIVRAESKRRRKDGSLVDVQIIRALLVVSGKRIGSFAMYEDITERARAEKAQRHAEDKFQRLFENAVEGIFQTTPEGVYLSLNPALARMYGYESPKEMMGAIQDTGRGIYAGPERREEFKRLIAERDVVEKFEYQVRRRDGRLIWISENARAVRDRKGRIVCYEGTVEDITDRKRLEEQFRQAQKMEAVGRLAGGIAHDFNNLLMVIQGYADLMGERLPPGDALRRNAEQIQIAAQRATALTRQLLAFSRKQILDPKVLNIQGVITEMGEILHRLIGEDIELKTSASKDLGLVKADRSQIEQVIMNLAVNARDAMPSGGRLTIETSNVDVDESFTSHPVMRLPGKYVLLAVTDNGCGMDAETQVHIFEPFFTTKEKGKGTGLGLATVYGIVKQSDGYIWVYSEPGLGTSFKIYLPRIEEESSLDALNRSREAEEIPLGHETILLVEDESGVRELAREYLETSGYKVIQASNGHEAIEIAASYDGLIHLLMTDVVMPGISGHELADRIVRMRPGIRILYMSGYSEHAVVHHGIVGEDATLLSKPFTLGALASKLREILATEQVA